jgi:hypothetical protein
MRGKMIMIDNLLLLFVLQTRPMTVRPAVDIESQRIILSKKPIVGETIITFYEVIPKTSKNDLTVIFYGFRGIRPISKDTVFHYNARQGQSKKFSIEVEYFSTPAVFGVRIPQAYTKLSLTRYLLSAETGEYGSPKEIQFNPPVKYRFNPELRIFEQEVLNFKEDRWHRNSAIIDTIKTVIPEISDSLALLLYSDISKVVYPPEISKWLNQVEYLLERGWQKYSTESQRIEFLNRLRAENEQRNEENRRKDEANRKRLEQERLRIQKTQTLRWLLSWLIPVTLLVLVLVVLLVIRSKKRSKVVTSRGFDRTITYAIYILTIGIALYFAWPYLSLKNIQIIKKRQEIPSDIKRKSDLKVHKVAVLRVVEPPQAIIDQLFLEFEKAGLTPEYVTDHIRFISARGSYYENEEGKLILEACFKWVTDHDWVDEVNNGEGVQFKVFYEYFVDPLKLSRMIYGPRSGHSRSPTPPSPIGKFYLRPIKNTISKKEARRKLFKYLPDEEKFFDIYVELNIPSEPSHFGNLLYLVGRYRPYMAHSLVIKVDLETGEVIGKNIIPN